MIDGTEVKLICATDIEPEPIQWLWKDWLAAGKFHILAGAPGTGKTTIGLSLAAILTMGGSWPDGTQAPLGKVLIWSGEDDPVDTLLPRLLAQGAVRDHMYFVDKVLERNKPRTFDPSRDLLRLYEKAIEVGDVRLILIDPVATVVLGDSHKNGEVRRALQPLVELANRLKAVVLGISHFNKGTLIRDPLERITGSIAFGALARVVLAAAKVKGKDGDLKRVLARAKSNNGPDGGGYYYQIEQIELEGYQKLSASKLTWGEQLEGTAQELLMDVAERGSWDEHSAFSEAIHFLQILLSEGPLLRKEIDVKAQEAGIKDITLRRAKTFLGIEAIHEGYGKGSVWKWCLPSKELKADKDSHGNNIGGNDKDEQV